MKTLVSIESKESRVIVIFFQKIQALRYNPIKAMEGSDHIIQPETQTID